MFLNAPPKKKEYLNAEAFSNMKNLRLLKISDVHLPQGLNYLSSKLRYIHWDGYTSESLPTIFEPKELVETTMERNQGKIFTKAKAYFFKTKIISIRV